MNKSIYLSHPLSNDTPLYGGAKDINLEQNTSISKGDTANSLTLSFPNHAGTHVDVPKHFVDNGKCLTDYVPSFWIFNNPIMIDIKCYDGQLLNTSHIPNNFPIDIDLLLIRTGYEQYRGQDRYWKKNPGLSIEIAQLLRKKYKYLRAVGIDTISISSRLHREEGRKAHKEFFKSDTSLPQPIVLIEDMALLKYHRGIRKIIVCPLIIEGGDGAPCTVLGI